VVEGRPVNRSELTVSEQTPRSQGSCIPAGSIAFGEPGHNPTVWQELDLDR